MHGGKLKFRGPTEEGLPTARWDIEILDFHLWNFRSFFAKTVLFARLINHTLRVPQ